MGVSGVGSDPAFASSLLQGLPSLGLGFLTGKTRPRTSRLRSDEAVPAWGLGAPDLCAKSSAPELAVAHVQHGDSHHLSHQPELKR